MLLNHRLAWVLLILICSGCATPIRSGSQCPVPPDYLRSLTTFTWHGDKAWQISDTTGFVSPLLEHELRRQFELSMANKGYRLVQKPEQARLQVAITLRLRRELTDYAVDAEPCTNCWESVAPSTNVRMKVDTVGFMALDAFANGEPVWRSWVEQRLYPRDRKRAHQLLTHAITKLLQDLPNALLITGANSDIAINRPSAGNPTQQTRRINRFTH